MRWVSPIGVLILSVPGLAQRPIVYAGGVVNGGSFIPAASPEYAIAPRSIISIFGENLARAADQAEAVPLPTQLAGTTVAFNGRAAPLLFVSPGQINAQVPGDLLDLPQAVTVATVIVTTAAGASDPVSVDLNYRGLGLFTQSSNGCGPGAILNVHGDGKTVSPNGPASSFDPLRHAGLSIFATGLGLLNFFTTRPTDGIPAPFDPQRNLAGSIQAGLGEKPIRTLLQVDFAGPSPQFAGVDQVNVLTADNVHRFVDGCHVPLFLTDSETSASQTVSVSIQHGGTVCTDPQQASLGEIRWEQNTLVRDGVTETSTALVLRFVSGVRVDFDALPRASSCRNGLVAPEPVSCPADRNLDAGTLTVQGPGFGPLQVTADPQTREYHVQLAGSVLTSGQYRVVGAGGADVGRFDTSIVVPPSMTVDNRFDQAGAVLSPLNWMGGDPEGVVTASVVYRGSQGTPSFQATSSASASAGVLDLCACGPVFPPVATANLTITVDPASNTASQFSAEGLTLGGRHTWRHRFEHRIAPGAMPCDPRRRSVSRSELGSIFTNTNGFDLADFGGYVGAPKSSVWRQLSADAVKVVHGRFHVFKPSDDSTWAWFPYTALKRYEAQEVSAGRPPLFVTATYKGKKRPVLWAWSLGLQGNTPKTPPENWERAVNVEDERFIRFWISRYVRSVLWQGLAGMRNLWVGLDECAFNWGLYGVLDDNNQFVSGVPWDAPFPQNETAYLGSIETFFRRLKELAPDVNVMCNLGSMRDWSRFQSVFEDVPGIMLENIMDQRSSPPFRFATFQTYNAYAWFGALGRLAILRALVPQSDPVRLRTAVVTYLALKGPNFFFAPQFAGGVLAVPPTRYVGIEHLLGSPVAALESQLPQGSPEGYRLYSRAYQNGIVYLNWTGTTQTITLPAGRPYFDPDGNPITRITVADLEGTYVSTSAGPEAAGSNAPRSRRW